jgi:hypothetical protein
MKIKKPKLPSKKEVLEQMRKEGEEIRCFHCKSVITKEPHKDADGNNYCNSCKNDIKIIAEDYNYEEGADA